ncbi:MAG: Pls/PosA family non-ribosomal peptide synthetase, partial [Pirellulales bacterium]
VIDTSFCGVYDLLTIGDDTCINSRTQLLGYRVEDGMLVIGAIDIGSRCYIGTHSCIGINTKMGDDCRLGNNSMLPDGTVMAASESRRGSPAEPAEVVVPEINEEAAARRNPLLFGLLYFIASEIIGDLLLMTLVPPLLILLTVYLNFGLAWTIAAAYLALPLNLVVFGVMIAGIKSLIMFRAKPGVYSVESWYCLRRWMVNLVYRFAGQMMYTVYATIYLPPWLRLLGAKVGRHAEVAMVGQLTPDLIEIGEGSFFADGSTIGGRQFYRGHVQYGINRIGARSFVGNSANLPIGASIGDNSLLGVLSTPEHSDTSHIPDNTEWLGSPPFQLPRRPSLEGFNDTQLYKPTLKLYVQRCFFDAVRILYPFYVGLTSFLALAAFLIFGFLYLKLWAMLVLVPVVSTTIAMAAALSVYVVKRVMIGKYKPIVKPLWSTYVWRNEVLNGAYEAVGAPIMSATMGTPFYCWYLRLLGAKIGKHAFIQTTFISEFELVDIGDYVALNFMSVVQNHLFEDRIMKASHLKIGDECTVGNMGVVLYDTVMRPGSSIDSLSLLMKGEKLPPNSRWHGIPTRPVRGPATAAVVPVVPVKYDLPKPTRSKRSRRLLRVAVSLFATTTIT